MATATKHEDHTILVRLALSALAESLPVPRDAEMVEARIMGDDLEITIRHEALGPSDIQRPIIKVRAFYFCDL